MYLFERFRNTNALVLVNGTVNYLRIAEKQKQIIKTNKLMEVEKLENENANDDYAVKLPKLLELSDEPERIRSGRTLIQGLGIAEWAAYPVV